VSLVHAAHSARADWGADPVRTYLHPRLQTHGTYILEQAGGVLPCGSIQRAVRCNILSEQRFELAAKLFIALAHLNYLLAALFRLVFQRGMVKPLEVSPTLGIHGRCTEMSVSPYYCAAASSATSRFPSRELVAVRP
jgi:hypothetical protein